MKVNNVECYERVGIFEKASAFVDRIKSRFMSSTFKRDHESEIKHIMHEYKDKALIDCDERLKPKVMTAFSRDGVFGSELEFDITQKSPSLPNDSEALKRCGLLMLAHMTSKLTRNSNNYSEDTVKEVNKILDNVLFEARKVWNMNSNTMEDYISELRSIFNADKCLCGKFSNPVFLDSASNNAYLAQSRIEDINLTAEQGGDFVEQAKKVVSDVHEVISLARVNGSEASRKYSEVKKDVNKLRVQTESAKKYLETLQNGDNKEDLSKVSSAVLRMGTAVNNLLAADTYIDEFFDKAFVAASNTNYLVEKSFASYDDSVVKNAKPYLKADNQEKIDNTFNELIRSAQTGVFGNNGNLFKTSKRMNIEVIDFIDLINEKEQKEEDELKSFMLPVEDVNGNKSILHSQELVESIMRDRRI